MKNAAIVINTPNGSKGETPEIIMIIRMRNILIYYPHHPPQSIIIILSLLSMANILHNYGSGMVDAALGMWKNIHLLP